MDIADPQAEIARLQARVHKLAEEKSHLQLIIHLIEQLNPLPGLEDMVRAMLYSIVECIGGTNIKLYYWIEADLHYVDFLGASKILAAIDDPLALQAAERREFIEFSAKAENNLMQGECIPDTWTWAFPLLVGRELIGVIQLENLHLGSGPLRAYLPIFFSHAALILGNQIRAHSRRRAEEALRQSRERLAIAADSAGIGVWDLDLVHDTLVWDDWMYRIYGLAPADFGGACEDWQRRVHPEDLPRALREIGIALGSGRRLDTEFRIVRPDGTVRHIKANAEVTRDPRGAPLRMTGVNLDISADKERTRELARAKEAAEAATRAKSAFLALMSHEIRTPLNAVLGFAQLGQIDSRGTKSEAYFKQILSSGQSLLGIINGILDFSRIEAGRLCLDDARIDLAQLLDRTAGPMKAQAAARQLRFRLETAADLPESFQGDDARLAQVLTNLLANAVKFTEKGSVTLAVFRDGEQLLFRVADTGIGMSAQQIEGLFQPFRQADDSISRKFGGTGLGLSLCKRLLEEMNGEIRVESQPERGSTFEVRLPLVNPAGRLLPAMPPAGSVAEAGTDLPEPRVDWRALETAGLSRQVQARPTESALDRRRIDETLARLEPLLEAWDTAANDLFEESRELLLPALGHPAERLGEQLGLFDYPGALETLHAIRNTSFPAIQEPA